MQSKTTKEMRLVFLQLKMELVLSLDGLEVGWYSGEVEPPPAMAAEGGNFVGV